MARVFAFEGENNQTLEWIPLDVRRKLDLAGAKISLAAWQQMSREHREELVSTDIKSADDAVQYHQLAVKLANEAGGRVEEIVAVPFDARPWATEAALLEIEERARALSIAIDRIKFAALDDGAKYALLRLSDPRKSEEKLRAAIAELNVAIERQSNS